MVEGDRARMMRLALRAASLLPVWDRSPKDARLSQIRAPKPGRFLVFDPAHPLGKVQLPDGRLGKLVSSFQTSELAVAFAEDQQSCGDAVVVVDSHERAIVYSSEWAEFLAYEESPPGGRSGSDS